MKNSSDCRKKGSLTDSPALCLTIVATTFTKRGTCKFSTLFENGQDGPAAVHVIQPNRCQLVLLKQDLPV